ncbi:hypothetical protein MTBBW1_2260002 [Desulfamplus magnetovallimortis]|uniref:Uncharacterized protein n=1 Tax=Desulfamplus magnetovallimortis TaxID=1246637 RepID=A0A1W1HDI3_9BACT|nr:hypothetical protein MTBBW1_2260002 [Desulfamplus magnetovallimortis]
MSQDDDDVQDKNLEHPVNQGYPDSDKCNKYPIWRIYLCSFTI